MYKKMVVIMVVSVFFITACANNDYHTPQEALFFEASIIQIDNDLAIVSGEMGEIMVDLSVNKQVQFKIGDRVKVGYDGEIKESYPAKINTLSVERIE